MAQGFNRECLAEVSRTVRYFITVGMVMARVHNPISGTKPMTPHVDSYLKLNPILRHYAPILRTSKHDQGFTDRALEALSGFPVAKTKGYLESLTRELQRYKYFYSSLSLP